MERNSFTPKQEIVFAQYLVQMHRNGEISAHNIGSHVVLEITRLLNDTSGTSFPRSAIRLKYYTFQNLISMYFSFKKRGTVMRWDSTYYIFMMDDGSSCELLQVPTPTYVCYFL